MLDAATVTKKVLVAGPVVATADVSGVIDRRGFESLIVTFAHGIGGITFTGTNRIDDKLQHSDDNITYTDCVAADVNSIMLPTGVEGTMGATGIVRSIITAHAAPSLTKVGYIGNKRYIKPIAAFGGTHATGTPIAIQASLGTPILAPVGV